jgi:two-component system response regulator
MNKKIILLVEDNPDDEELTLRAFKQTQIPSRVIIARDGVEALDYLFGTGSYAHRELSELPQLILLDLKLPKVTGLEVLQRLRANPPTQFIPVIVLTSSNEENDILSAYRLGANSYVRKAVDFYRFIEQIQLLCRYWLVVNQAPPINTPTDI